MSAGYTNLRTVSYRDTIAELLDRAKQTHTRATGVQVFSPGDGMAYEDAEGFVNPISPALFDDAKGQIAEASEALVAVEAELEAAQVRIDETAEVLDAADQAAAAAVAEARAVAEGLAQMQATGAGVTPDMADQVLRTARAEAATAFVTDRLVVGTGTDATVLEVLGAAVVNDLNLRGTLRGRDAILTGTVDVAQLNVTGDMAAEIGRFMSVETKKLIVTEAAVMQHVTAIEGIITPKITASEAKMGSLIAERASIEDLAAGNLTLAGHFRSGAEGKPSVIIPQNYRTQAGMEQLGVWLSPSGVAPSLGAEWGTTAGIWLDNASNTNGSTNSSPLHIRGQSGEGMRIYGGLKVSSRAGSPVSAVTSVGAPLRLYGESGRDTEMVAVGGGSVNLAVSGGGGVNIRSGGGLDSNVDGSTIINTGNMMELTSGAVTTLQGPRGVVLSTNSYLALRRTAGSPYDQTTPSSGSWVSLFMDVNNGRVYRSTSARRYKARIEPFVPDPSWLDMPVVTYVDAKDPENGRPQIGTIAEDALDHGAESLVMWSNKGAEDYRYEREVPVLRYFLREHRDKIADLESRIAELESALL